MGKTSSANDTSPSGCSRTDSAPRPFIPNPGPMRRSAESNRFILESPSSEESQLCVTKGFVSTKRRYFSRLNRSPVPLDRLHLAASVLAVSVNGAVENSNGRPALLVGLDELQMTFSRLIGIVSRTILKDAMQ